MTFISEISWLTSEIGRWNGPGELFVPGATAAVVLSFTRLHIVAVYSGLSLPRVKIFGFAAAFGGGGGLWPAPRELAQTERGVSGRVFSFLLLLGRLELKAWWLRRCCCWWCCCCLGLT